MIPNEGEAVERKYKTATEAPTATAKRDSSELVEGNVLGPRVRGTSISYELSAQIVSRNMSRRGEDQAVGSRFRCIRLALTAVGFRSMTG
jgi:hypothetical protein